MKLFDYTIHFEHPELARLAWVAALATALIVLFSFVNLLYLRRAYAAEANLKRTSKRQSRMEVTAITCAYALVATLMMLALAAPYEENRVTSIPSGSINLVGAFDVSNSMAAEDYREVLHAAPLADGTSPVPVGPWGSRLQMARAIFTTQVMDALPGNGIGVAVYTADPWPVSPLNRDYSTLRRMLASGWLRIGGAPGGGSDFVEGLSIAVEILRRDYDPLRRQVIVLFSDGGLSFASDKEKQEWQIKYDNTVKEVKALNAEVVIIALGSTQPQMVPVYHPQTLERVGWFPLNQPDDKKEKTALDRESLNQLAAKVGGKLFHVDPSQPLTLTIDWVNALGGRIESRGKHNLASYPLCAALACFSLLMLRACVRRRSMNVLTQ